MKRLIDKKAVGAEEPAHDLPIITKCALVIQLLVDIRSIEIPKFSASV
jgi:hypothetical protein